MTTKKKAPQKTTKKPKLKKVTVADLKKVSGGVSDVKEYVEGDAEQSDTPHGTIKRYY